MMKDMSAYQGQQIGDAMDVNLLSKDMELNFSSKNDDNDELDSKPSRDMDRGTEFDGAGEIDEEVKEEVPQSKGISEGDVLGNMQYLDKMKKQPAQGRGGKQDTSEPVVKDTKTPSKSPGPTQMMTMGDTGAQN